MAKIIHIKGDSAIDVGIFAGVGNRVVSRPMEINLAPTGDGSGVATLRLQVSADVVLTASGGVTFYDAPDKSGPGTTRTVTPGALRTIYVGASSTGKITADRPERITRIGDGSNGWVSGTNAPTMTAIELPKLVNITYIRIEGQNTLSGTLPNWPNVTYLRIEGSNTISGTLPNWPNVTNVDIRGNNTISGTLPAWPNVTFVYIGGSNTLSGTLPNWPNVTNVYIGGSNTISGAIPHYQNINTIYLFSNNTSTISDIEDNVVWTNMRYIVVRNNLTNGMLKAAQSKLLVKASNSNWYDTKTIDISQAGESIADTTQGGFWGDFSSTPAPSAAAVALKTLVKSKGCTVMLRGCTMPGTSGDGTGFPTGFGDWWRS